MSGGDSLNNGLWFQDCKSTGLLTGHTWPRSEKQNSRLQRAEHALEPFVDFGPDRLEVVVPGHVQEALRIDRAHRDCPVIVLVDDVTGEQRAELGLLAEPLERQPRVARAEDAVLPERLLGGPVVPVPLLGVERGAVPSPERGGSSGVDAGGVFRYRAIRFIPVLSTVESGSTGRSD